KTLLFPLARETTGGYNAPSSAEAYRVKRLIINRLVGYPSGQRGQTVNLLAYAFDGSNPSPTTISFQTYDAGASLYCPSTAAAIALASANSFLSSSACLYERRAARVLRRKASASFTSVPRPL